MADETIYERMVAYYESENVPWDDQLPPPEVIQLAERLPAGRVLDIGCGYGRTSIYLNLAGWDADGVDFVEKAVETAAQRAATVGSTATFSQADVTDLSFLTGPYDLVVDIGCAHSLDRQQWGQHAAELHRLLRPGGQYLLFARIAGDDGYGLNEPEWRAIISEQFTVDHVEYGETVMKEGSWRSGWFYLSA